MSKWLKNASPVACIVPSIYRVLFAEGAALIPTVEPSSLITPVVIVFADSNLAT